MPTPSLSMTDSLTSSISSSPRRRSSAWAQSTNAGSPDPKSRKAAVIASSRSAGGGVGSSAAVSASVELREVVDQRHREQLLLAGEVPIDDGAVDADGPRDVIDLGVADAAFVEQRPGGVEDLALALCAALRSGHGSQRRGSLSVPARRLVGMRSVSELRRQVAPFQVVSDFSPGGDQPAAITDLERRINAGEQGRRAHGCDRHRQDRDGRLADRAAAASDAW